MLHSSVALNIELEIRRLNASLNAIHCFVHVYIYVFYVSVNFMAYLEVKAVLMIGVCMNTGGGIVIILLL